MRGERDVAEVKQTREDASVWRRLPPGAPMLLGALAGLLICALGYFALNLLNGQSPAVTPTVQTICADLTTQRYDHLYTLLNPALQAQGTQRQFVASQAELDRLQGKVTSCAASATNKTGAQATTTLKLTRAAAGTVAAQVSLNAQSNTWRIAAYNGSF